MKCMTDSIALYNGSDNTIHLTHTKVYQERMKRLKMAHITNLKAGERIVITGDFIHNNLKDFIGYKGHVIDRINGKHKNGSVDYYILIEAGANTFAVVNSSEINAIED